MLTTRIVYSDDHLLEIEFKVVESREMWSLVLHERTKIGGWLGIGGRPVTRRLEVWPRTDDRWYRGTPLEVLCDSLGWFERYGAEGVYLKLPCILMELAK